MKRNWLRGTSKSSKFEHFSIKFRSHSDLGVSTLRTPQLDFQTGHLSHRLCKVGHSNLEKTMQSNAWYSDIYHDIFMSIHTANNGFCEGCIFSCDSMDYKLMSGWCLCQWSLLTSSNPCEPPLLVPRCLQTAHGSQTNSPLHWVGTYIPK